MPGPDIVQGQTLAFQIPHLFRKSMANAHSVEKADNMTPVQLESDKKITKTKKIKADKKSADVSDEAHSSDGVSNGVVQILKSEKKRKRDTPSSDVSASKVGRASSEANDVSSRKKEANVVPDPCSVANFRISELIKVKLKEKGIEALFPIQAQTFDMVFGGDDLVARARTGQGKTLAFVLPILEVLTSSESKQGQRRPYGRAPSVIVLAPTRELAKQVHADFEFYGNAVGLSSLCVYGGAPYGPQEGGLRRGVDIVVGTPGRIKDHLERGNLNLKTLKFRVLDEADEMLNMGFMEHVELILGSVEDSSLVQTLLFSATMPPWVQEIASKFFKASKKTVDLVGDDKMKASASVKHLLLPCAYSARSHIISDIIRCYSSGGRSIVFTETKKSASELAGALTHESARALHGDIPQGQREVTLAGFRSGKFSVLVATDVAARGLDINDVQLIIQCEPPRDVETYIHRSGRTGRAGKKGVCVTLYDRKKEYMITLIQKRAGFTFERITAPQPSDIAQSSLSSAVECISEVSDRLVEYEVSCLVDYLSICFLLIACYS
ncbi:hypothetical protein O6H91_Y312700 [Diphasiastrum complanatum]|nr:hypothetical protein O6H91_Y312700 [Diphasiastrum complanatum]